MWTSSLFLLFLCSNHTVKRGGIVQKEGELVSRRTNVLAKHWHLASACIGNESNTLHKLHSPLWATNVIGSGNAVHEVTPVGPPFRVKWVFVWSNCMCSLIYSFLSPKGFFKSLQYSSDVLLTSLYSFVNRNWWSL